MRCAEPAFYEKTVLRSYLRKGGRRIRWKHDGQGLPNLLEFIAGTRMHIAWIPSMGGYGSTSSNFHFHVTRRPSYRLSSTRAVHASPQEAMGYVQDGLQPSCGIGARQIPQQYHSGRPKAPDGYPSRLWTGLHGVSSTRTSIRRPHRPRGRLERTGSRRPRRPSCRLLHRLQPSWTAKDERQVEEESRS